ncbi:MAG TPA: long-chain fatty acid--CoA ligase [Blastocatellia bacterium]|nr:long-chain fatty acid--CoA ligase [Blastocatellia bacterium]
MTTLSLPETLVELLREAVAKHRKPDALKFKQNKRWVPISSDELLERVRHTALALDRAGIGAGDRVALLAESGPLWTISDFGILATGAVNVPIYPTQTAQQVEYILSESTPKVIFVSTRRQIKRIGHVLEAFPDLRVVTFEDGIEGYEGFSTFEAGGAEVEREQPDRFDALSGGLTAESIASIIYTSGTTGEPKGVLLSHRNIVFDAVSAAEVIAPTTRDVALSFLPLSHIFERTVIYLAIHCGVTVCYAESLESVAANLAEVRPTLMTAVPRFFEKVYEKILKARVKLSPTKRRVFDWSLPIGRAWAEKRDRGEWISPWLSAKHAIADKLVFSKWRDVVGNRMERFVSGGAPLSPDLAYVFWGAGIPILQGYGLTETSPVIAVNALGANRMGTVGRPIPEVEVKIAEDGEVLTRGPHIFPGYFNKPEATAEVLTEDGWLRTGDIGAIDKDGFLSITDRKKDLIKTSAGKYVPPQPIENLLRMSPLVEQIVLVGNGRKHVSALIVPNAEQLKAWADENGVAATDGSALADDPRVISAVRAEVARLTPHLADYERIKGIALLKDEFTIDGGELTPTLKVRRRFVEEKYRDIIDALYRHDR